MPVEALAVLDEHLNLFSKYCFHAVRLGWGFPQRMVESQRKVQYPLFK